MPYTKESLAAMPPEKREQVRINARERIRRYRAKNKELLNEKARVAMAEKRARDPKKAAAAQRAYANRNKEKLAVQAKARRQANLEAERKRVGMVFPEGVTIASLKASQGNLCPICKRELPGGRLEHVDHDHESGIVRGILDHKCNVGMGHFDDDPERLEAAAAYIRKHRAASGYFDVC